jgi:GMP synthase (glutamine-hydrolysing)
MQLLAMALGSPLHRQHGTEIGFGAIEVVAADPVLDPLGPAPTVLHWHADAVDLPAGASLLARSERTPVQAFRAGSALGLQFHVEVGTELLAEWLHTPEMTTLPEGSARHLLAEGPARLRALRPRALAGLSAFADAVRARG